MTYEQMCAAIREMAENSILILSEDDREFILGLSIMLESDETVPAAYLGRVSKIHHSYLQAQYA